MNVASWNVRTLLDRDESSNAERRTAIVARELAMYNVDIAALSETRLSGENQFSEKSAGYTIFWKGKAEGEKRERGVGFAQRTEIIKQLEQPYGVSDRILCLRAPPSCGRFITVISMYAPTLGSNQESIMAFYQDLHNCISSILNTDKILLLGDFNARVRSDHGNWNALGQRGIGKMKSNGLLLLRLCTEFELAVCNTFYQ